MKRSYFSSTSFVQKVSALLLVFLLFASNGFSVDYDIEQNKNTQQKRVTVKGTVTDQSGPLTGLTVSVKGTTDATSTSINGEYTLLDVPANGVLVFTFIGMKTKEIPIGEQTVIDVEMEEDAVAMGEVVVVAFGTQKKESLLSSIETINPKELKVPSSNLTTALAGRMSGVIAYQRSGEPGKDNADFFIRGVTTFGYKKDPLILIDGVETSSTELARLQPDDIEAFSILKDATATALYGARGANGVIQVTTKRGEEGPAKVTIRFENAFSQNTKNIKLADPITFMRLANEAALTRNPLAELPYSNEKIDNTIAGINPYAYPTNDWRKLLLNDTAINQRVNASLSGGGKIARYYVAATFNKDDGNLKVDKRNNFNSNIKLNSYQIRANIDIDVTKTTQAAIRMSGSFDDYNGPIHGGEGMYKRILQSNPVLFPAYYPSEIMPKSQHILFGNATRSAQGANYLNPYAEMVKGYKDSRKSLIDAQVELKQDFSFLTDGLKARAMFNTSRYSFFDIQRYYSPHYYGLAFYDRPTDTYDISLLNEENNPHDYLTYHEGWKDIHSTVYIEGALSYNKRFDIHDVSGLLVYQRREQLFANRGSLQKSLPYRNQGVSGRFTYGYNDRYLAEFNFGYNGSERFHKSERYGFFPAAGAGWYVSNEGFWKPLKKVLSKFKLKGTYGLVGNDAIGDENDRFFYLSQLNMNDEGKSYRFGSQFEKWLPGINMNRYGNTAITWEKSYKLNLGLEMRLFNDVEFQIDYFTDKRKHILMDRSAFPQNMGLSSNVRGNVGEAKGSGVDFSIDYNKVFKTGFWIQGRANFTYASSEFVKYEEPKYEVETYLSKVGQSLNRNYGLIAERLFVDEHDVANSPLQSFGEYGAGDIKYHDVNGDGVITDLDKVPIGFPTVPEIIYGFGFSLGNDRIDFSAFFQGSARSSFWIDMANTMPFRNAWPGKDQYDWKDYDYMRDIPLLKAYADDHWSETNRDIYALWPRLSTNIIENNVQTSTWGMRNGAFLRGKTVEIGYTFPKSMIDKLYMRNLRVYASGTNLLTFSGFKLWDIEMGGNGLGYPIQRVMNLGIQIGF